MNHTIHPASAFLSSLLGLVAISGCEQPPIKCIVARGGFAARYELKKGSGPCAEHKGDIIGLQGYHPAKGDEVDFSENETIALQLTSIGTVAQNAEFAGVALSQGSVPYSLGRFTTKEPEAEFCDAGGLTEASVTAPEIPSEEEGGDPLPATSIQASWKNLSVYVTPEAPGTQLKADLTLTEDGCTAEYHVVALWPAISCDDGEGNPAPEYCAPEPPEGSGLAYGSGISPDFPVECDPDTLLCVLKGEPPALK